MQSHSSMCSSYICHSTKHYSIIIQAKTGFQTERCRCRASLNLSKSLGLLTESQVSKRVRSSEGQAASQRQRGS